MEKPTKPKFYYSTHFIYTLMAITIFIYSQALCRLIYPHDWFELVGRLITLLILISVYSTLFVSYKQKKSKYTDYLNELKSE